MMILNRPNTRTYYSIKVGTGNLPQTIAAVQKKLGPLFPNDPFEYFFLNESFNQQYKADSRLAAYSSLFAFLAILIACFGLLDCQPYNVLQRTKEIGIRKVLGASVRQLIVLLFKRIPVLVLSPW